MSEQGPTYGAGIKTLIPGENDSERELDRKAVLLSSQLLQRMEELRSARSFTDNRHVREALTVLADFLEQVRNSFLDDCAVPEDRLGWERFTGRIAQLTLDRDNAPDPAIRDMLSLMVDELETICVDEDRP